MKIIVPVMEIEPTSNSHEENDTFTVSINDFLTKKLPVEVKPILPEEEEKKEPISDKSIEVTENDLEIVNVKSPEKSNESKLVEELDEFEKLFCAIPSNKGLKPPPLYSQCLQDFKMKRISKPKPQP